MVFISEIFRSAQGEGLYIGLPQVFVRFSGCFFDCPYCDTDISSHESFTVNGKIYQNPVTEEELANILLQEFGDGSLFHSYSITGGEPLIHSSYINNFISILKPKTKAKFFLETSGLLLDNLSDFDGIFDIMSIDIKTHSKKVLNNLPLLLDKLSLIKKSKYYLKLLLDNESFDVIDNVLEKLIKYKIKEIVVQPVNSIIDIKTMDYVFDVFFQNNISARIIPQTHKILCLP